MAVTREQRRRARHGIPPAGEPAISQRWYEYEHGERLQQEVFLDVQRVTRFQLPSGAWFDVYMVDDCIEVLSDAVRGAMLITPSIHNGIELRIGRVIDRYA